MRGERSRLQEKRAEGPRASTIPDKQRYKCKMHDAETETETDR